MAKDKNLDFLAHGRQRRGPSVDDDPVDQVDYELTRDGPRRISMHRSGRQVSVVQRLADNLQHTVITAADGTTETRSDSTGTAFELPAEMTGKSPAVTHVTIRVHPFAIQEVAEHVDGRVLYRFRFADGTQLDREDRRSVAQRRPDGAVIVDTTYEPRAGTITVALKDEKGGVFRTLEPVPGKPLGDIAVPSEVPLASMSLKEPAPRGVPRSRFHDVHPGPHRGR